MTDAQVMPSFGYVPTDEDRASVLAWFERYDALAAAQDYEGMADEAVFPLNEVTDDGTDARAEQVTRDQFLKQMAEVMGGAGDARMDVARTPHFLSPCLVFVVTEGTLRHGDQVMPIRYGDLLLKSEGRWRFQTMVQGGWA